jgi:hypothetical protein
LELKRQKEQKRLLYEEVSARLDTEKSTFQSYQKFVETEFTVKDAIIDKQKDII